MRSSCEASATNWRRCCSFSRSRDSEATRAEKAAWIRSSMTLSARARRPTSVGLVGTRDALVEVAGRNGVGGALDVLERAQAEPDQPPAAGQGEHERAGRHGELGQEQGVQRAGLVDERLRLHEHVAVLPFYRPHPEGGAARTRWSRGEVRHLGPVGLGREARDRRGQLRAVRGLADVGGTLEIIDDRAVLIDDRRVADPEDVGEAASAAPVAGTGASRGPARGPPRPWFPRSRCCGEGH